MGRGNSKFEVLEGVRIESLAAEGRALARTEKGTLFVSGCVPGDIVRARAGRKRKGVLQGTLEALEWSSPLRQNPICTHFGVCGGCQWQILPYTLQLAMKQQQVEDQLRRIGGVHVEHFDPIVGASPTVGYRNKLEYTFSPRGWRVNKPADDAQEIDFWPALGFHVPGRFDRVLDIKHCHLQDGPSNGLRDTIRTYALGHKLPFYDARTGQGWLRGIIIRTSCLGETMLVLIFAGECDQEYKGEREGLLSHILMRFPNLTSLYWCVNGKVNDSLQDVPMRLYHGAPRIQERLGNLIVTVGPKSFYQTNSLQAERLYNVARQMASLRGGEIVYDLYCGTGTIGLYLARDAVHVVGVESIPEAIADAWDNAQRNDVQNIAFEVGDVLRVVDDSFLSRHGTPDVVVTDPPRAGMHPDVVSKLLSLNARKIVYVSCNPATQARDLSLLSTQYRVGRVRAVDMFPHTKHVESCALLLNRNVEW